MCGDRFLSDADVGGTEKLCITAMRPDCGMKPAFTIHSSEIGPELETLLDPMGAFLVKGWSRSFCALSIMACAWENEDFRNVGILGFLSGSAPGMAGKAAKDFLLVKSVLSRRTLSTVHCTINVIAGKDDVAEVVLQNRGASKVSMMVTCIKA